MSSGKKNVTFTNKKGRRGVQALPTPHSVTRVPRLLFAAEMDAWIPFYRTDAYTAAATGLDTTNIKINTLADSNNSYIGISLFNPNYRRYRVLKYDITAMFLNKHASSGLICSGLVTNSGTAPTTNVLVRNNMVQPGGKHQLMSTITGGSDVRHLRFKGFVSAFEGTKEVETSDTYAAALSPIADPTNLLYLQLAVIADDASSITFNASVTVTGMLLCRFFDAIQV